METESTLAPHIYFFMLLHGVVLIDSHCGLEDSKREFLITEKHHQHISCLLNVELENEIANNGEKELLQRI